ncbi:MAG: hypothetical protein Q8941_20510 [Bacteroidota bacterium]|nr:hypothetical protein [Bacteroidota bacterium]
MKNLLFILILFTGLAANAQFGIPATITNSPSTASHTHHGIDTCINADTITHIVTATAGYNCVTLQATTTKVSGTVAGKAYVYYGLDGTNYNLVDSLTLADVTTNFKTFAYAPAEFVYYKIVYITSGTQKCKPKTLYLLRKNVNQ